MRTTELFHSSAMFEEPVPDPNPQERIAITLQYWEGDRDKALELARFLAGIERGVRNDVVLLLVHRRDADPPDSETMEIVQRTFPAARAVKGVRTGRGHPGGCNALWVDSVMALAKLFPAVKYGFTTEADVLPLRRDWINALKIEAIAMEDSGALVSGHWSPGGDPKKRQMEHINGNMLVNTNIVRLVPQIFQVPPDWAWDLYLAAYFMPKWRKGDWIYNGYVGGGRVLESDSPNKRGEWYPEELMGLQQDGFSLVHGVRDDSGMKFLKKVIDLGK